jgi:hypothetical protein
VHVALSLRQLARSDRPTDIPVIGWFVLAAWLSRQPKRWADEIARNLHGRITTPPTGMLALVVADALPSEARKSLAAAIPPSIRNDLRSVLTRLKIPPTMSFPLDPQIVSFVVHYLDYENTGGKFVNAPRASVDPDKQ